MQIQSTFTIFTLVDCGWDSISSLKSKMLPTRQFECYLWSHTSYQQHQIIWQLRCRKWSGNGRNTIRFWSRTLEMTKFYPVSPCRIKLRTSMYRTIGELLPYFARFGWTDIQLEFHQCVKKRVSIEGRELNKIMSANKGDKKRKYLNYI